MHGYWKHDASGDCMFVPSDGKAKQQIGVFWIVGDQVVKDSVPLGNVVPRDGMARHGDLAVIRPRLTDDNEVMEKLLKASVDTYPRGTVVFLPEKKVFRLYFDRRLQPEMENKVVEAFDIGDFDIESVVVGQSLFINGCNGIQETPSKSRYQ